MDRLKAVYILRIAIVNHIFGGITRGSIIELDISFRQLVKRPQVYPDGNIYFTQGKCVDPERRLSGDWLFWYDLPGTGRQE